MYKLIHNIDNVNYSQLFDINHSITRGHDFKLKKRFSKTNSRKFTFSQRTVNDWNSLPPAVVYADDIKCFKTGVDQRCNKYFICLLKGNRNNKTFLQRLRCILCVITLHSIISYYKMRFYTRKTELEASTCKFPRNL